MAEDQAASAQQDSQKASAIPDGVSTGGEDHAQSRGKYLKMLADNKEVAKKYGQPDFQSLLNRIGSDGAFAQQFVMAEIGGDDAPKAAALPDAPQENNITGKMDHTGDTPTKLITDFTTEGPATSAVESK